MKTELTIDEVSQIYYRLNQLVSMVNSFPDTYASIATLLRRECRGVLLDTSLWLSITDIDDQEQIINRISSQLSSMLQVVDNSIKQYNLTPRGKEMLLKLRELLLNLMVIYK